MKTRKNLSLVIVLSILVSMTSVFTAFATAIPQDAVNDLRASYTSGQIRLDWTAINNSQLDGYYVYRTTDSQNYQNGTYFDFPISQNSYVDTKLTANTTYYYIVKPVYKGFLVGNASNQVSNNLNANSKKVVLRINDQNMEVDNRIIEIDPGYSTRPMIIEGRTMLPIRAIIEQLGGTVEWDSSQSKVTIRINNSTIILQVNSYKIVVNGIDKYIDVYPQIINGRTFIPLRSVIENIGCTVEWDVTQKVTIYYTGIVTATPTPTVTPTPTATPIPTATPTPTATAYNHPPILYSVGNMSVKSGQNLTFVINGVDANGDKLIFSATGALAKYFNPSTRYFSWTPNANKSGTYKLVFKVSDGYSEDTEEVKITVNNGNRQPILSGINKITVTEGQNVEFAVNAKDPDNDTLTYFISNKPKTADFNSSKGKFVWKTKVGMDGTYKMSIRVSDGKIEVSQPVTIQVIKKKK